MEKDRTEICRIISHMLDNPDANGIYPTSTAYTRLELYIESARAKAIGWMHAKACVCLDMGGDPRIEDVGDMLKNAMRDLEEK